MELKSKVKTVCVFGKGELAIEVCKIFRSLPLDYSLELVVPVLPEPNWTESFLAWSKNEGINVKTLKPGELYTGPKFDLGFSCFYNKIFNKNEIDLFNVLLNLHNGPLPRYRGVNPINWALKNKENNHGVTIHRIEPGIDTGPIYGQIIFPINDNYEVRDVLRIALNFGKNLADSVIRSFDQLIPYEQDHSKSSYYSTKDFHKLGERAYFTRNES